MKKRANPKSPALRCCVLTVAVTPVRMGSSKQELPLAQCMIPLGHIDPAYAHCIMQRFVDGEDQ